MSFISKTGIIGNPKNASAIKGKKLAKITIITIEKIKFIIYKFLSNEILLI